MKNHSTKLYMGFLCDECPDIRIGRRSPNMRTAINAVRKANRPGYVMEYNTGKIVYASEWEGRIENEL